MLSHRRWAVTGGAGVGTRGFSDLHIVWMLQNLLYFRVLTSVILSRMVSPILGTSKHYLSLGKILRIYSGLLHRMDCTGAVWAIIAGVFFRLFSALFIMLTRKQSFLFHCFSYTQPSIYYLGIVNGSKTPHMSSSSGVRANVNVSSLILLEKWWCPKMLATWKCLDMQSKLFFARVALSLNLIHSTFISYTCPAVIFQEKYKSQNEFIWYIGGSKTKIKTQWRQKWFGKFCFTLWKNLFPDHH